MSADPGHTPGAEARVGFCAILGLPNVGKSTLLNCVLDARLVAVSNKPQTTRNRILGVLTDRVAVDGGEPEPTQIIFVDTPGIQHGKGALRRYMREQALAAAGESDVALLVIDAGDPRQRRPERLAEPDAAALLASLRALRAPVILVVNKVDRLADKAQLLPILQAYGDSDEFADQVPISAQSGDGVDRVVEAIARHLPRGPKLFPDDMITDRAERFLAAELIREQLFRQLGKELPYATAVTVEEFQERSARGDLVISAIIYVERESQKGIVVGKGGARIRELGEKGRAAISELFDCPVHLKLHVKVAPDWSRQDRGIRQMGYE